MCWMSVIFLLPVCLTYWPRKYTTRVDPHATKFQVDMTIHYRVIAFLSADTSRDLVTLTFDPLTLNSCRALRVTSHDQPCHEVWRLYAYPFLTLSYNVSRRLPLKMRMRPLRMRRITWPVSRGSKTIKFLKSPTPICLFTIKLLLGYDDD